MNFQTILEELNRLYEEDAAKATKEVEKEAEEVEKDAEEVLTEAVEEEVEVTEEEVAEEEISEDSAEEIEIVDDENEVAQLVLECDKCGALTIKTATEVTYDEESGLANVEEACQYCESEDGHKVIGTFNPYAEEAEEEVEETEEVVEEPSEEALEAEEELTELLDFDVPISVNANVKADGNNVPVLNTALEELETSDEKELDEGIFDSKATKQKQYEEDIKNIFGNNMDSTAIANKIVISAVGVLKDASTPDGDEYASKNQANSMIKMITAAKATINKTPQALVKNIREIGSKYAPNSNDLDDVNEFMSKVRKLQTASKTGYKAMEFLFEKINKLLASRMDQTINFLKKEYSIVTK